MGDLLPKHNLTFPEHILYHPKCPLVSEVVLHLTSNGVLFHNEDNVQLKRQLLNFRIAQNYELLQMGGISKTICFSLIASIFGKCPKLLHFHFYWLGEGSWKYHVALVKNYFITYVERITSQREKKCYKETS